MAEALFTYHVHNQGLDDQFEIDSAGTGEWHLGEAPHAGTHHELVAHGVAYDHRARLVTPTDLRKFDYILAMDRENLRDLQAIGKPRGTMRLFLDYNPECGLSEVPDPYYTGRFDQVYALADSGAQALLSTIRLEHSL